MADARQRRPAPADAASGPAPLYAARNVLAWLIFCSHRRRERQPFVIPLRGLAFEHNWRFAVVAAPCMLVFLGFAGKPCVLPMLAIRHLSC